MSDNLARGIKYKITGTRNTLVLDRNNVGRPGYRITFTWEPGFQDYVDILREDYNHDTVHAAIQEAIAKQTIVGGEGEVS